MSSPVLFDFRRRSGAEKAGADESAHDSSSAPPPSLNAQLQNSRLLLQFIKSVSFGDDLTFVMNKNGIKLTVEEAKVLQANAFLQTELFRHFDLSSDDAEITFRVSLSSLVDCLSLFGSQQGTCPVLCIRFDDGDALRLWLEEAGTVVEISAQTRRSEEGVDFGFSSADIKCKVIMTTEHLKDLILSDLDTSSEHVELTVSQEALVLSTSGTNGDLDVHIPRQSSLVNHFSLSEEDSNPVKARYRLSLFKQALKPLGLAEKVSLRIDSRGILCIQYMVKVEELRTFLEFLCLPEEEGA